MAYFFVSRTSDNHPVLNHLVLPCRTDFGGVGRLVEWARRAVGHLCDVFPSKYRCVWRPYLGYARIILAASDDDDDDDSSGAGISTRPIGNLPPSCHGHPGTSASCPILFYASASRRLHSTRPFTTTYRLCTKTSASAYMTPKLEVDIFRILYALELRLYAADFLFSPTLTGGYS